ncbi:hypothetical protein [Yersinia pekkanenii]|uniref:Uncharacterized protein n=1 Tax=Yersinia pekkanenii TaxID=1288385 RepID=A0A0T9PA03_9GAMM|nr:hypothetical protein [Yersinia pekkanenii]CNH53653.1 Uncharacterised protein [Yersinia pekkanenii]CRY67546.1 Uncharacterised protein [Yersinia pekkanenii]
MYINIEQYKQARNTGAFESPSPPQQMERITLKMLTGQGRRELDVGYVVEIKLMGGCGRCMVTTAKLVAVKGIYV